MDVSLALGCVDVDARALEGAACALAHEAAPWVQGSQGDRGRAPIGTVAGATEAAQERWRVIVIDDRDLGSTVQQGWPIHAVAQQAVRAELPLVQAVLHAEGGPKSADEVVALGR